MTDATPTQDFTFVPTEPNVAYEYRVYNATKQCLGRVHKQEAAQAPYLPTGQWIADTGIACRGGFPSRKAAAAWLQSWRRP